jgi:hypothetical protein
MRKLNRKSKGILKKRVEISFFGDLQLMIVLILPTKQIIVLHQKKINNLGVTVIY